MRNETNNNNARYGRENYGEQCFVHGLFLVGVGLPRLSVRCLTITFLLCLVGSFNRGFLDSLQCQLSAWKPKLSHVVSMRI